jgi:hypothetical protein
MRLRHPAQMNQPGQVYLRGRLHIGRACRAANALIRAFCQYRIGIVFDLHAGKYLSELFHKTSVRSIIEKSRLHKTLCYIRKKCSTNMLGTFTALLHELLKPKAEMKPAYSVISRQYDQLPDLHDSNNDQQNFRRDNYDSQLHPVALSSLAGAAYHFSFGT